MYYAQRNTGMGELAILPAVLPLIGAGITAVPAIASLFKKDKKTKGYTAKQVQEMLTQTQQAEASRWTKYMLIGGGVAVAAVLIVLLLSKKDSA